MFTELPETNQILEEYPYIPLDTPAENVAERLIVLGHLTYNPDVWASSPDRRKRYWKAFLENVEGSSNTNRVSVWWAQFTDGMASRTLNNEKYLHEKNLLLDPTSLSTPVEDRLVLEALRNHAGYLVDRARIWVRTRSSKKSSTTQDQEPDLEMKEEG